MMDDDRKVIIHRFTLLLGIFWRRKLAEEVELIEYLCNESLASATSINRLQNVE